MPELVHQSSRWRAAASPGGLIGLFFVILCLVVGVTAYLGITDRFGLPLSIALLWGILGLAVAAGLLFVFLFWAYLSIGYRLDDDALHITWGFWSRTIPLNAIQSVAPAEEELGPEGSAWRPLWSGYYIGRRQTDAGEVQVVATLPRRRQVLIVTSEGSCYAISPERPLLFMEELAWWRRSVPQREPDVVPSPGPAGEQPVQQFVDAGWTTEYDAQDVGRYAPQASAATESSPPQREQIQQHDPGSTRAYRTPPSSTSPLLRPILLRDPVSLSLIAVGVLATAAMVTYILVQYDDIPPSLTLHWNAEGLPGRVGEPREIWILPTIAGLVLLANLGLAWSIALFDRFAARLMLGASIIAHIVTWVALLMIIG